jgi:hypothetical protein
VEFPPAPVVNETANDEWWAARENDRATIYDAGLHNSWDWGHSPRQQARKAHGMSYVDLADGAGLDHRSSDRRADPTCLIQRRV